MLDLSIRSLWRNFRGSGRGFSVICAYNNQQKLQSYLISSLERQVGCEYELILIDNRQNTIASAAAALNEAAATAGKDYLCFVHQDVALLEPDWLSRAENWLSRIPDLGAAGVAGCDERGIVANVMHGTPARPAGEPDRRPRQVQTLDGCLLIVPKPVFRKRSFDEKTVAGWYLYVLDYCLDLKEAGLKSYVLPETVYHESMGPSNPAAYEPALARILEKHRTGLDVIYGTMGVWRTDSSASAVAGQ